MLGCQGAVHGSSDPPLWPPHTWSPELAFASSLAVVMRNVGWSGIYTPHCFLALALSKTSLQNALPLLSTWQPLTGTSSLSLTPPLAEMPPFPWPHQTLRSLKVRTTSYSSLKTQLWWRVWRTEGSLYCHGWTVDLMNLQFIHLQAFVDHLLCTWSVLWGRDVKMNKSQFLFAMSSWTNENACKSVTSMEEDTFKFIHSLW